ncbi:MAG: TOBE domain-containing protein, partial [Candidatus Bathyarchaeia archaeon]
PATVFVAKFFGEINMLTGQVKTIKQGYAEVSTDVGMFKAKVKRPLEQRRIVYSIRPEKVAIGKYALKHKNQVKCKVTEAMNKGTHIEYLTTLPNNSEFKVLVEASRSDLTGLTVGTETMLGWDGEDVVLIEKPSVVPGIDIDKVILGI